VFRCVLVGLDAVGSKAQEQELALEILDAATDLEVGSLRRLLAFANGEAILMRVAAAHEGKEEWELASHRIHKLCTKLQTKCLESFEKARTLHEPLEFGRILEACAREKQAVLEDTLDEDLNKYFHDGEKYITFAVTAIQTDDTNLAVACLKEAGRMFHLAGRYTEQESLMWLLSWECHGLSLLDAARDKIAEVAILKTLVRKV
jgi:hypothetical protein